MKSHEFRMTAYSSLAELLLQMMQDFPEKLSNCVFPALLFEYVQKDHTLTGISRKPRRGRSNTKSRCSVRFKHSQPVFESSEPDYHTHTYPHTNSSQGPAGPVHQVEQEETGHRDEISVCERDRVDVTRPLSEQRKPIGSWI